MSFIGRDTFIHTLTFSRSVQLPEEIDMGLWAQLENELERVDQDGAEGAGSNVCSAFLDALIYSNSA